MSRFISQLPEKKIFSLANKIVQKEGLSKYTPFCQTKLTYNLYKFVRKKGLNIDKPFCRTNGDNFVVNFVRQKVYVEIHPSLYNCATIPGDISTYLEIGPFYQTIARQYRAIFPHISRYTLFPYKSNYEFVRICKAKGLICFKMDLKKEISSSESNF